MAKIIVSIPKQTLELFDDNGKLIRRYSISTSKNGVGEQNGSFRTPRGKHIIRAKIGAGHPPNTVFVERRSTGEIFNSELFKKFPKRDWILTRILWLSGCEKGFNRLGSVDTMRRCVYIHGSPDHAEMGKPGSHGCIRMHNSDVIDLFDRVLAGISVEILET